MCVRVDIKKMREPSDVFKLAHLRNRLQVRILYTKFVRVPAPTKCVCKHTLTHHYHILPAREKRSARGCTEGLTLKPNP